MAAGEDACESRASLRLANRLAPCVDRSFGRIREEGVRLLFTDAFERGKIRLGPAGIVAADGVDDFRGQSAEDARVQGSCESSRPGPRAPAG